MARMSAPGTVAHKGEPAEGGAAMCRCSAPEVVVADSVPPWLGPAIAADEGAVFLAPEAVDGVEAGFVQPVEVVLQGA
jgi:hypothetical protein